MYFYYPLPSLSTVSPSCGPTRGGSLLNIEGTGFINTYENLRCKFEGGTVYNGSASFVDTTSLKCSTPEVAVSGQVPVYVSLNSVDYVMASTAVMFTYHYMPEIESINPATGPVAGNTRVTITGTNFDEPPASCGIVCRVGLNLGTVEWVSETQVICITPAVDEPETVVMELSLNGQDFSDNRTIFEYYESPRLSGLVPPAGPENGGTIVSVRGTGFLDTANLACRFGAAGDVEATFISPLEIQCTAPVHTVELARAATFRVTLNGQDFTTDSIQYYYYDSPKVLALVPNNGAVVGGTSITVVGTNFFPSGDMLRCKFGDDEVPATYLNATKIVCLSPGSSSSGLVPVEVTVNGQDYTSDKIAYAYSSVHIASADPTSGPTTGGTTVTITGFGFADTGSGQLVCRFNDTIISASFVNYTQITCQSPAVSGEALATIAVSLDGQEFTRNLLSFRFYVQPTISAITPRYGPSSGGSRVVLTGSNFEPSPLVKCRFGTAEGSATFISQTEVHCLSPPYSSGSSLSDGTESVSVAVALNGVDFSDDSADQYGYYVNPTVSGIYPHCGELQGGTPVTLFASNVIDVVSGGLTCRFGTSKVNVSETLSNGVVCLSPPAAVPGRIAVVQMSLNGQDFTDNDTPYYYYAVPKVYYTEPFASPYGAETEVLVAGANLTVPPMNYTECTPMCIFGNGPATPAVILDTVRMFCPTPSSGNTPGENVTFQVSLNGVDLNNDGENITFMFFDNPSVNAITPTAGATTGDTRVTVTGSNFHSNLPASCMFGERRVPAVVLSSTSLYCVSPPNVVGTVALEVSFNGIDYTSSSIEFSYYAILATLPSSGPLEGGTVVSFVGAGFVESSTIRCRFGSYILTATYVSSNLITCTAPGSDSTKTVILGISINGQQFSTAPTTYFLYYEEVDITSLTPTAGSVSGGSVLSIATSGLSDSVQAKYLNAKCLFTVDGESGVSVSATVDSTNSLVTCVTPDLSSLNISSEQRSLKVLVSLNGEAYASSELEYTVYGIEGMYPTGGPACPICASALTDQSSDGTCCQSTLTVKGYGFSSTTSSSTSALLVRSMETSSHSPICVFGSENVTGTWVDDSSFTCAIPFGAAGSSVNVSVSVNGADYIYLYEYTYTEVENITSCYPTYGPLSGGSAVTIYGSGFTSIDGSSPACLFGTSNVTTATYVNSTTVICDSSPSYSSAGNVSVRTSPNGVDFSHTYTSFYYYATPTITSINPTKISSDSAQTVTVTGTNFFDSDVVTCVVGTTTVTATYVSTTQLKCAVPQLDEGSYTLQVSLNGEDYTTQSITLTVEGTGRFLSLLIIFVSFVVILLILCIVGIVICVKCRNRAESDPDPESSTPPPPNSSRPILGLIDSQQRSTANRPFDLKLTTSQDKPLLLRGERSYV